MGKRRIRTFDLFCGGGGSSRGAYMAGATPVAALDRWNLASKTYKLNFPKAKVFRMKAGTLTRKQLLKVGKIDLLLASPECTSHSIAKGSKPGCEISRTTAFEVIRLARILQPRWLVVENVMQMRRWRRFEEWHERLKAIGYHTTLGILDAKYFGTPQSRRRLFIVGDLKRKPSLPRANRRSLRTVKSILGTGEPRAMPWRFSPLKGPHRAKATIKRAGRAFKKLGKRSAFIMVYYGTDGAGGFQALNRPLRTVTTLDRFAYVRPNCKGHEMRMLQPPELASAMGFPVAHSWAPSTRRERIKLIGNAVAPPVMRAIIKELIS